MKLEVGMYIRDTRKSKIYKLTDLDLDFRPQKTTYDFEKASHNITDLIEENGIIYQVDNVDRDYVFTKNFNDDGKIITLVDYQIETILTKEQFENNCFRIGE